MGARYDDEISQGVNYLCWIQIKRVKQIYNNDTDTKKYRTVTIRATNLITYGDASYFLSYSVSTVGHIPFHDLVGKMDAVLL